MRTVLALFVIFVINPVGYLFCGWLVMREQLPAIWAKQREEWTLERNVKQFAHAQALFTVLFWPFTLIADAYRKRVHPIIDAADPKHREQELKRRETEVMEREWEIAALERELGIGQ